jgi:hypothetical protein
MTRNEIDAAKSVRLDYLNVQGQPRFEWPATFALARAYLDQLDRDGGLGAARIAAARGALAAAERAGGGERSRALAALAAELRQDAASAPDAEKVRKLADAVERLAAAG